MKRKKIIVQTAILCATALLAVVACLVLPDTVAIQWNSSGASNYASKYVAALIPLGLSALLVYLWNTKGKREQQSDLVWGLCSCLGIVLEAATMIMNL